MSRAIDPGILRGLYSFFRSGIFRRLIFIACLGLSLSGSATLHAEDVGAPRQSKTGPVPPDAVVARDAANQNQSFESHTAEVTLSAPGYSWRHGCGPTAVGMVIGYYDGQGYQDLIPGDASTQTGDVNQAIASGGTSSNPNPPGSEEHYEDYARPQDSWPTMLTDDYITQGRTAHTDNSIADYMHTSKSTHNNYYGWSWSNHIGPAFTSYVNQQNAGYNPGYTSYYMSGGSLTWNVLTTEINNGRPMVFLVDTDGNGGTDHFVTIVGYRDTPALQYGCLDTWSPPSSIRWENFQAIASDVPWGIWGGWSFSLVPPPTGSLTVTIYPPDVRTSARWRLTTGPDTTWKQSDDTISTLDLGNYTLQFNDVSGWKKPDDRLITITEGSNSKTGTYYEYVYFADPNLKVAVEVELGFTNPTINDMLLLTSLDASKRGITDLTGIGYAVNLGNLYLRTNQLSSLPPEFGNLVNLTNLYLQENQLSHLPPEIGNLVSLANLYLQENQLSDLPPEIGHLTNLTGLFLYDNHLSSLPPEIGNLTNLTVLSLDDNQLSALPSEIGNLVNLTDLYLHQNQLSALPSTIGNLVNLTELWLNDNQLSSLPSEFGNLVELPSLRLYNNQLSSIPPEIGNLVKLRSLHLWSNQLNSLPPEIGNLVNLTYLYLHKNQLSSLPPEIGNLNNLERLYLDDNQFSSPPSEIWNLVNLTVLGLYDNQLSSLPPEIGNLVKLKYLYLWSNQLTCLPLEIGNLTELSQLYLNFNPLNTAAYCRILPLVEANNPGIDLRVDPNPNPLTNDCSTDLGELMVFLSHWLETDCGIPNNFCSGADLDHFDEVNLPDFNEFSALFLAESIP